MRPSPLVAVLLLCASPAALAQPSVEEARSAARRELQEGAHKFDEGDYAAALAHFEEAYRHFPSPRFFYNMGQAQRLLARDVEALESFERFLKEAADAPASARADAEASVVELRRRVGTLDVSADVPEAELAVDGRSFGVTPRAPIRLAPGLHQIVVEKVGYEPFLDRLEVQPGANVRVRARLARRAQPAAAVTASLPTAPVAAVAAGDRPAPGHGGQLGLFARADVAPLLPGYVLAPGLSYGIGQRFELQAAALIGHFKGAWAGGRLFLLPGDWKPMFTAGVPFFFADGASVWGLQAAVGLEWDPTRAVGVFADVGAAVYPSAPGTLGRGWLLSSVGVQARY